MLRKTKILFLFIINLFIFTTLLGQVKGEKIVIKKYSGGAWIGVKISDITNNLAEKYKLKNKNGVLIEKVEDDSPADKAGLKKGDIIIEYNGKDVISTKDLIEKVNKSKPDEIVKLVIIRNDDKKTISVKLEKRPKDLAFDFNCCFPDNFKFILKSNKPKLGLQLIELNPELGEYFQSPTKKGMLVKKVEKDSPADKAGIKTGDVIIGIGMESVEDLHDITSALKEYKNGDKVELTIIRKGEKIKIPVEIDQSDYEIGNSEIYLNKFDDNFKIYMKELNNNLKTLSPKIKAMIKEFKFDNLQNPDCSDIKIEIEKIKPEIEKLKKEFEKQKYIIREI